MSQLKTELNQYWSNRAEGYSEYNHGEMEDGRSDLWRAKILSLLAEHFGDRGKETISVLDIGTGPGLFAIMLAKEGYQVTGLDYSEAMLAEAQKNAGDLAEKITWVSGDAENLPYKEGTFDAIVTRNVTWNLPNPDRAYQEWYRVLKPGGYLMNFDADWYGYLYDEEKRQGFDKDRSNVKEQELEDYYDGGGVDNDWMEALARKVPLSRASRPTWDCETMVQAGFAQVLSDAEVWKEVWNEAEMVNNSSTPQFLVTGCKEETTEENRIFRLCNASVAPGTRWSGEITLSDGETRLPVTILHGKKEGKTALVTAGVHAAEYVGIQTTVELAGMLSPEHVVGTIVLVKVLNRPAFEQRKGSLGVSDEKNLNRVFPGDPSGSEMERLAALVVKDLFSIADYHIDLHSGDDFEELTSYVYYAGKADPEVVKISRQMAEQVDVPYMVKSNVATGGAYNYAASLGIPSVLLERGGCGLWNSEETQSMRQDVRNILCKLGVYLGAQDYRKYYPMEVTDVVYQAAMQDGLWYPAKHAGDIVKSGDVLGKVRDYEGNLLETSTAISDGVILYQTSTLQVQKEGPMVAYGRIRYEKDDRKERIVKYWGKRSESFLAQRRHELYSAMADRWRREIGEMLPEKKHLRILDVGCGTGFFTILLAMQGHEVIGVDLTPEMIENSRLLAEEEGISCEFRVMDAEQLEFESESFDVVISRNLTWTLPHAEIAYESWMRVLKKGGVLINFDANYGLSNFADTKGLPEKHAHNMLDESMRQESEELKRQLPISSYSRPAWDLETLSGLGVEKYSFDLGISKRIYLEKDEFYNPTPLFSIRAVK